MIVLRHCIVVIERSGDAARGTVCTVDAVQEKSLEISSSHSGLFSKASDSLLSWLKLLRTCMRAEVRKLILFPTFYCYLCRKFCREWSRSSSVSVFSTVVV